MLAAIYFDNQTGFMTDEIDDVTADRLLPLEFQVHEAMCA